MARENEGSPGRGPGDLLDPKDTDLNHNEGAEGAGCLNELGEVHTVPPF